LALYKIGSFARYHIFIKGIVDVIRLIYQNLAGTFKVEYYCNYIVTFCQGGMDELASRVENVGIIGINRI